MTEKSYYPDIAKFYEFVDKRLETITWEAKLTKTNSLLFNAVMDHQEEFLLKSERVLCHKIADVGRLKKPFDGAVIRGAIPVVIAIYYKPRAAKSFEILLRDFIKEKFESERKSLTLERAREIAIQELYL